LVADEASLLAQLSPQRVAVPLPDELVAPRALTASCEQVLTNTALNVVEFGDGSGTAEPWATLFPIVYFTNDPGLAFDGTSLLLEDLDSGDTSPTIDAFAQGFLMPDNLSELNIEYQRATLGSNTTDKAFGELWLLDDEGFLNLDDPDTYFVANWEVTDSDMTWQKEIVSSTDGALLNEMEGRWMAIIMLNVTNGVAPVETILFVEVRLSGCTATPPLYLPMITHGKQGAPVCAPPTENPPDEFSANRGLVQTGSVCNSTLSNIDRADYYTFEPTTSGSYTLRLTNLPAGSEWAAMIFVDAPSPSYAPGPTGGQCRIATPGAVNKQVVCPLQAGQGYFVKVSAGSTPLAGSYRLQITR
jgi:hypothetical protein